MKQKFIAIDEEGYFLLENGIRVADDEIGHQMLSTLRLDDSGVCHLSYQGHSVLVECFDKPYVAQQVLFENNQLKVQMPHQLVQNVINKTLCIDEWDRFHGYTENQIPFVLTRKAQAEFFNLAESFTDESITLGSEERATPPYYIPATDVEKDFFWTAKYDENPSPGWNLDRAHPELLSTLQQLKLNKSRILVPGCGYGHDAALLAQRGHVVTAIDFSASAIKVAKEKYGHIGGLRFEQADIFNLESQYHDSFDLIFEHTLYCAISPFQRSELIQKWQKYLNSNGHLLGIFFVVPKRTGPYFGGSEWELREKLARKFNFLYWTRLKHSPDWRNGAELLIYAQKKA